MSRKCSPGEDKKDAAMTGQKIGQHEAAGSNPDSAEAGQGQEQKPEHAEKPADVRGLESIEKENPGGGS